MKTKTWKKIFVAAFALLLACIFAFSLVACGEKPPQDPDDTYGSLEDFFKDFFDDWEGGDNDEPDVDWTEKYGEIGDKDTFIDATLTQSYNHTYGTHMIEAESATLTGQCRPEENSAASGGKNLGYTSDSTITFTVYADADCTALLGMCMAVESGRLAADMFYITYSGPDGESKTMSLGRITVSGASWTDFKSHDIGEVELQTGENTITITSFGGFNLDYITLRPQPDEVTGVPEEEPFVPTPSSEWEETYGTYEVGEYIQGDYIDVFNPAYGAYMYEAEYGKIVGNGQVSTENPNASGGKYVNAFNTGSEGAVSSHLSFTVFASEACTVLMKTASSTDSNERFLSTNKPDDLMTITLAGRNQTFSNSETTFAGSNGWLNKPNENTICELPLAAGRNVIDIETKVRQNDDAHAFNIDYIALLPVKSGVTGLPEATAVETSVPASQWEEVYGDYTAADMIDGFTANFNPEDGPFMYEAEKMKLGSGVEIEDQNKPNASGGKQISGFGANERTFSFTFTSDVAYTALVSLRLTGDPNFDKTATADNWLEITQNYLTKVDCSQVTLDPGNWEEDAYVLNRVGEIKVRKGINRIGVTVHPLMKDGTSSTPFCVDYISLFGKVDDISTEGFETPPLKWNSVYGDYVQRVNGYETNFNLIDGAFLFEAENATISDGLSVESNKVNASGKAQVGGLTNDPRTVTIEFESDIDYTAMLSIGVTGNSSFNRANYADYYMDITCNDEDKVNCTKTKIDPGNWNGDSTYVENKIGEARIRQGHNKIELVFHNMSDPNCFCLDYILLTVKQADKITPAFDYTGETLRVEAEDCDLQNCRIEGGVEGKTSGKNLGYTVAGTTVKFAVQATSAGDVTFTLCGATTDTLNGIDWSTRMTLEVNGASVSVSGDNNNPDKGGDQWYNVYKAFELGTVHLNEGRNEISITMLVDGLNLDYFEFAPKA